MRHPWVVPARTEPYSPYAQRNFPDRPLWGDTHLHTAISFDAGALGTRLLPPDAYRFAKGEEVISSAGQVLAITHNGNLSNDIMFPESKAFGKTSTSNMSKEVPLTTTERAYTSPIWYKPKKG